MSSTHLDELEFPSFDPECAACAVDGGCSSHCKNNYLIEVTHADDQPYIGWYLPYVYLKQSHLAHPDDGPKAWVDNVEADGSLASCTAQKAAQWLLGWSNEEVDAQLVAEWTAAFQAADMSYTELIREIVSHPVYRRRK